MKVVILVPFAERLGGAEATLWAFLAHVERTRIDATIVFLHPGSFADDVAALGYRTVVLHAGRLRHVNRMVVTVRALMRLLRTEQPEVIVDWAPKAHLYGSPAAVLAGMSDRVVMWQHGIPEGGWMDRLATALPTAAVGCPSDASAAGQRRLRPRRPVFIVPPGVDAPATASTSERGKLRASLGLPPDAFVVGIVGRLQYMKGQHVFLEALSLLREGGRDVRGLIVGGDAYELSTTYPPHLQREALRLGLKDAVVFTGQVPDAGRYIELMDVLVSTSTSEAFGLTIVEAMARMTPVVAVRSGGPEEIIEQDVTGDLVGRPEPGLLADALVRMIEDPERRRSLAERGRERYAARFTAQAGAERIYEAFERASVPTRRASTLRLLIIAPWGERLGGAETNLRTFLQHVDRDRIDPTVVFLQSGPFALEIERLDVRTLVIPAGRLRHVHRAGQSIVALARLIRSERPDLILNWTPKAHLYGGSAAALAGSSDRTVWWQRGVTDGHWMDRLATLVPAVAISCSSHAAAQAQSRLRPRRRLLVLHPGVAVPAMSALDAKLDTVSGLPTARYVVGMVGRLHPSKGQHLLLEALAEIRRRGNDVHCVLVGGDAFERAPRYPQALRQIATELGLADHVTMTGHVADPGPWVQSMDIVVSASETESFGLTVAEAMARSKVVVSFRSGGPEEIIEADVSGILIEHSSAQLADTLERLLLDPELRLQIGTQARARIGEGFAAEGAVRHIEAALEELSQTG